MDQTTVRFPADQREDMDEFVEESDRFADRSEFIRTSISRMLNNHEGTPADRLRDAAAIIDDVASAVPSHGYDEAKVAALEEEYGEIPDLDGMLYETAQVIRKAAIVVDIHEDVVACD